MAGKIWTRLHKVQKQGIEQGAQQRKAHKTDRFPCVVRLGFSSFSAILPSYIGTRLICDHSAMGPETTSFLRGLASWNSALTLVGVWFGYRLLLALYNISPLHPLARFPGPKVAAASYLYEAWYDWILVGRYGHKIREMHERYGAPFQLPPSHYL
jgi:hypothetical protein